MPDDKSQNPQPTLSALDQKISRTLGDRVILKPLTRWNEAYKEFPRYVMEYLVSRYVDPTNPVDGQKKIDHPEPHGSKDVTDGAAGAAYDAMVYGGQTGFASSTDGVMSATDKAEQSTERPLVDMMPKAPDRPTRVFEV